MRVRPQSVRTLSRDLTLTSNRLATNMCMQTSSRPQTPQTALALEGFFFVPETLLALEDFLVSF
jgi:hypothetical protein